MNWNEIFEYRDGNLLWKSVTKSKKQIAGHINNRGYRHVCVKGKKVLAHRIVWEMFHGTIPKGLIIDHIDRDQLNNRIENLRLATIGLNHCNSTKLAKSKKKQSRFRSKYKGVTKNYKMFYARLMKKIIGKSRSEIEAARIYDNAALIEYNGHAVLNRDLFPEDFK